MTDSWLSWKHQSSNLPSPLPFVIKVDIFFERIDGWQLQIADTMMNTSLASVEFRHGGFAAVQICLSYFETIGKYRAGICTYGDSSRSFHLGLRSVFPDFESVSVDRFNRAAELLYGSGRCGLYHASQAGSGILLRRQEHTLMFDSEKSALWLDPHQLPVRLRHHLGHYCQELREPTNRKLRQDFEKRFDFDNPALS